MMHSGISIASCVVELFRCKLVLINRHYFVFCLQEHMNYVGIDQKHGHTLMSVQYQNAKQSPDNKDNYKVILRLKDRTIDKSLPTTTFSTDHPGPRDFMKVSSSNG